MNRRVWLPIVSLIIAAGIACAAHMAWRRRNHDCGDYWEQVLRFTCYFLGIPLFLSVIAESLSEAYWSSGWHLQFDRVSGSSWAFPLALTLPFVVWLALILVSLRSSATAHEHGNWLAGSIGFTSRKWVVHCAWLLLVPLWLGGQRLDMAASSYPAAAWGTVAVIVISLVGIAWSAGRTGILPMVLPRAAASEPVSKKLPDWPEAMDREGFDLERLTTWQASSNGVVEGLESEAGFSFLERLRLMEAANVAPQVTELFQQLISPASGENENLRSALLIAPDDCGQVEALALAAHDLLTRFNEVTLVISPLEEAGLVPRLRFWLSRASSLSQRKIDMLQVKPGANLSTASALWLVDADTLSDDFMGRLSHPELAARIGLTVWWNVHSYTGVLAANMWAISRRLHRVLQERRGTDLATLATARYSFYPDAELPAFVRRLLPYSFDREVQVGRSFPRNLHVYRLTGQKRYFGEGHRFEQFGLRSRHLPVVAAYASAGLGWPTELETGRNVPEDERQQVFDLQVAGQRLGDTLAQAPAAAGARILCVETGDTLSLVELIAQGGRATSPGMPHHVALSVSENPYVNFLIQRFTKDSKMPASRRLIVAEGQEAILKRHLLLALAELEDTRSGLLHSFRWEQAILQEILQEIASQKGLTQEEVRYLDNRNELQTEYRYKSMLAIGHQRRPLNTISDKPIMVRDVDAPFNEGGVRMQVDPDRLVIEAYPGRVFLSNGLRYRVRDWNDREQGFVACVREAGHASTWRIRASSIIGKEKILQVQERAFGRGGLQVKSFPLVVQYQEYFDGVLRREYDLTTGGVQDRTLDYRDHPSGFCSFETTALILQFLPGASDGALRALSLALRYVLPVHLGVEDDALEVVPLLGQMIMDNRVDGLAIVDLYPKGIGLADAIHDDQQLVQNLLEWTARWLIDLVRKEQKDHQNGLRSPLATATGGEEEPEAALSLLRQVVAMSLTA